MNNLRFAYDLADDNIVDGTLGGSDRVDIAVEAAVQAGGITKDPSIARYFSDAIASGYRFLLIHLNFADDRYRDILLQLLPAAIGRLASAAFHAADIGHTGETTSVCALAMRATASTVNIDGPNRLPRLACSLSKHACPGGDIDNHLANDILTVVSDKSNNHLDNFSLYLNEYIPDHSLGVVDQLKSMCEHATGIHELFRSQLAGFLQPSVVAILRTPLKSLEEKKAAVSLVNDLLQDFGLAIEGKWRDPPHSTACSLYLLNQHRGDKSALVLREKMIQPGHRDQRRSSDVQQIENLSLIPTRSHHQAAKRGATR